MSRLVVPVGRDGELRSLDGALESARRGRGSLVWLVGEGGIGKTCLVQAAMATARDRGMAALAAAAEEFERHRPFAVVADCLRVRAIDEERRRRAAALLSTWASGEASSTLHEGGELELATAEALHAVVEEICSRQATMLVLEDLQWADDSSLAFLARLARRVSSMGLLVLCTTRRLPRRADLERILAATRQQGAREVEVGALDGSSSEQLARKLLGADLGDNLREQLRACGGNPLFIRCLLDALLADGAIRRADGSAEVQKAAVPASADVAVLGWLGSLSEVALDALRLAAVLGSSFSVTDLSLLSGRPAAELWDSLREALAAGAVVERGEQLAFGHDVVREALYRDLPHSVRAALHLDFARALAAVGGDAGMVAEHLMRGARPGDREAVGWLHRAARQAAPRSAAIAAELLEAALALAAPGDPQRSEVLAELGLHLVAAGRRLEGEEICRQALADEAARARGEGRLRLTLARSLVERGRLAEALAEADLAARSPGVAPAARAEALSWGVLAPLLARDLDAAQRAAEYALEVAREADAEAMVAFGLTRLGQIAAFRGQFAEQERWTAEAVQVAERCDTREVHHASHAHLNHAFALADSDRLAEALESVSRARELYQRLGMEETLRNSHHYAGYPLMLAGAWDDALAELETAAALSAESGISWTVDVLCARAVILACRDRLEEARDLIARARADIAAGAPEFRFGWCAWAQALLQEALGESDAALETLWDAWTAALQAGVAGEGRTFAPDLSRLLAQAGEPGRLRQLASGTRALAVANPGLLSLEAVALACESMACADPSALERACAVHPTYVRPRDRALLLEQAAVALAQADERERAAGLAADAQLALAQLAAERDLTRLRARMREAGVRLGERGARRRPSSGWHALTASERRVAELAAEGLSNPAIAERLVVSRHTVATHISHVLTKLGLRSRYELAAARSAEPAPPGLVEPVHQP